VTFSSLVAACKPHIQRFSSLVTIVFNKFSVHAPTQLLVLGHPTVLCVERESDIGVASHGALGHVPPPLPTVFWGSLQSRTNIRLHVVAYPVKQYTALSLLTA